MKTYENPARRQQESCYSPQDILRLAASSHQPHQEQKPPLPQLPKEMLIARPCLIIRRAQTDWLYVSEMVQAPSRSSWAICKAQYNNLLVDNGREKKCWLSAEEGNWSLPCHQGITPGHFPRFYLSGCYCWGRRDRL